MNIYTNLLFLIFTLLAWSTSAQDFDGYALYNDGNTAYLIDVDGDIAHRWNCSSRGNYSMFLKANGNIVRGAVNNGNAINGAAVGGLVQEIDPQGNVVWEFTYSTTSYVSHHDITEMPDGGVLLTAWEVPSFSELQDLGFQGPSLKYPTQFVEVQQDGTGGKIVWEWHMKDHFVQDVDPSLANYGVIADNPQLMDINVDYDAGGGGPGGGISGDWFHVNGVSYDPAMDQIIFSSRFLSEIFIIDHSTTSAEAAGHTAGNSGKGGDFLWRWGNPANYDTPGNRNISAAVHDAQVVPNDGRLFADYAQIFNNEGINGASQVDNILLPRDGFNFIKEEGVQYGPAVASAIHIARNNVDGQSASFRLPNGNLYVNLSRRYQYEVDQDENLVWQYSDASTKGFRVTCDHPGVQQLISMGVLSNNKCTLSATKEAYVNPYVVSPNPSNGIFNISHVINENIVTSVEVTDVSGRPLKIWNSSLRTINISEFENGIYFLNLNFHNQKSAIKRIVLNK